MKIITFLSASLGFLSLCLPCLAQQPNGAASTPQTNLSTTAPAIPIEQQVYNALVNPQHTFMNNEIENLAKMGNKIFPYLSKYKTDPNAAIRTPVCYIFARVHTPEAIPTLIDFLLDPNASAEGFAQGALYCNYEPSQIMKFHRQEFRKNLLTVLDRQNTNGQVILMLSAFKNDPDVISRLQSLRLLSEESKKKSDESAEQIKKNSTTNSFHPYAPDTSLKVDFGLTYSFSPSLTIALDVALAEMGDKAAVNRVREIFRHGTENERIFIFKAAKFVNNKQLLTDMVGLLTDKTILKSQFGVPMPSLPHPSTMMHLAAEEKDNSEASNYYSVRVCDLALYSLAAKSQIDIGVPDVVQEIHQAVAIGILFNNFPGNYHRYSDAELAIASERLKKFYKIQ